MGTFRGLSLIFLNLLKLILHVESSREYVDDLLSLACIPNKVVIAKQTTSARKDDAKY